MAYCVNINVNVIIYQRANVILINESKARKTHTTKQEDDGISGFSRLGLKESTKGQNRISR